MIQQAENSLTRRQFVKTAAAATTAMLASPVLAAPAVSTDSKTDTKIILGEGDHRYVVHHGWAQLPKEFEWQTTHNCTIDVRVNAPQASRSKTLRVWTGRCVNQDDPVR